MKQSKVLVLVVTLLLLTFLLKAQQRIINGSAIDIPQRPYQAAVFIDGSFNGGGVIISPEWILTAAHVVYKDGVLLKPSSISVSTGYTNLTQDTNRSKVGEVIVHPNYYPSSHANDIALVKLVTPLSFGSNRQAIVFSNRNTYPVNTSGIVSGWGRSNAVEGSKPTETQLYKADVKIQSSETSTLMANVSASTPYKGDSGGPLTIQDATYETLLVGLVSYTSNPISPTSGNTFYTNVGTYLSWIYQIAGAISGPAIVHNQGNYSLAKTFNPSITPTWTSSNTNVATINSQGQLIRTGTASGEITITATINNNGTSGSIKRNILVGLPSFDLSCINNPSGANYQVGNTYYFFGDPQWGDGVLSNSPLTYDWGYSKLNSSGQAGEWIRAKTYTNTSFVNVQPAYTFTEPGTYRIEMYARDGSVTSGMNAMTITVNGYYRVALNGSYTLLTLVPEMTEDGDRISRQAATSSERSTAQLYSNASLKQTALLSSVGKTTMDISLLPAGIYYLVILKGDRIIERHKVLIRR